MEENGLKADEAIFLAFIQLAKHAAHVDKITVKMIAETAHVSRRTFYTYFHDVYTLMDSLKEKYAEGFEEISDRQLKHVNHPELIVKIIDNIVDYVNDNRDGIDVVVKYDADFFFDIASDITQRMLSNESQYYWQNADHVISEKDDVIIYSSRVIAYGIGNLMLDWLKLPNYISIDKIKRIISMYAVSLAVLISEHGQTLEKAFDIDDYVKLFHSMARVNESDNHSSWLKNSL